MVFIWDDVYSGLCSFGMVSIRDGAHLGLCPFEIAAIRDHVQNLVKYLFNDYMQNACLKTVIKDRQTKFIFRVSKDKKSIVVYIQKTTK